MNRQWSPRRRLILVTVGEEAHRLTNLRKAEGDIPGCFCVGKLPRPHFPKRGGTSNERVAPFVLSRCSLHFPFHQ